MAISLPYYLGLTELLPSVSDAWYEPATVQGNFLVNTTGSLTRTLNNSGEDFTVICTVDKLNSATNSGAVGLLKGDNWNFGIDQSNFFFINSQKESYTFDGINLGQKNCFALSKNGTAFTVTKYNVPSQAIENSQTQFISPASAPTGTGLIFGGASGISGVKNFYGTVDQLAVFNQPLGNDNLNTLFSGFLRQTVLYVPLATEIVLSYSTWEGTGGIPSGTLNFLSSGAQFYARDVISYSPSDGQYYGEMDLADGPPYSEISYFDPTPIVAICPTFGLEEIGFNDMGPFTGLPPLVQVPVFINYNQYEDSFYSFDFSAVQPGLSLNLTYSVEDGQSSYVFQNTGYYTGFYMYGIVSPEANATMLGNFNTGFQYVNKLGAFDVINGDYFAPGAISNDRVFLDGLPETGYVVNGTHVSISNLVETAENQLIYDELAASGLNLQYFNVKNYSTGKFFPKTAAAFTGDQSFVKMWRVIEDKFLETHPYHLYHGKEIPDSATGIYNNTETNWSNA